MRASLLLLAAISLIGLAPAQQLDNAVSFPVTYYGEGVLVTSGYASMSCGGGLGTPSTFSIYGGTPSTMRYTTPQTATVTPGRNYTVTATSTGFGYILTRFIKVPGYEILLDGMPTVALSKGQNYSFTFRLEAINDITGSLAGKRGGECSSITEDKPIWYVGLGSMRNGSHAGAVGFRAASITSALYNTSSLLYDSIDTAEIDVVRVSGYIRQILAREVFLDIDGYNSSGTSYAIRVYRREDANVAAGKVNGLWTLKAGANSPFITYTIQQYFPSAGVGIRILKLEDGATWATRLEYDSGTAKWTLYDWRVANSSGDFVTDAQRIVSVASSNPSKITTYWGGPNAQTSPTVKAEKSYTNYSWDKELTGRALGDATLSAQPVSSFSYYTASTGTGWARALQWQVDPNGNWTKFDYYNDANNSRAGQVYRIYRPWLDYDPNDPSSPQGPANATTTNCLLEEYSYAANYDGSTTAPSMRETKVKGTTVGKTTWSYNFNYATANSHTVMSTVRNDYASAGSSETTTTLAYRPDDSMPYFRGKLHAVTHPDGSKESFAYFNGSWNEGTRTFTAGTGDDKLILRFQGQTSGGTSTLTSWTKDSQTWTMASVDMVAAVSTVTETVIDTNGRRVFYADNVFKSDGTLDRITGTIFRFDSHGRPSATVDVMRTVGTTEFVSTKTYTGSLLDTETTGDGVKTKHTYGDNLLRMTRKTIGEGGSSPYGEKIQEYVYDYANQPSEAYPCSCSSTTPTSYFFDSAGRLYATEVPSPNQNESLLTTKDYETPTRVVSYPPVSSTQVAGNPAEISEEYRDGRTKFRGGASRAPAYFIYGYNSSGIVELQINHTDASSAANGFIRRQRDWLGRVVKESVPTWGWAINGTPTQLLDDAYLNGTNVVDRYFDYNTAGQLWRERTVYRPTGAALIANTLHTFDAGGRPVRDGLDVNGNDQLVDASSDRIMIRNNFFEADSWGWRHISDMSTLRTPDSATSTMLRRVITRLTGFYANSLDPDGGLVTKDVVAIDTNWRWSVTEEHVYPTEKRRRLRTLINGGGSWAWQDVINGYEAVSQNASGVRSANEFDGRGRLSVVKSRWDGSNYGSSVGYTYHDDTGFVDTVTAEGVTSTYSYAWNTDGSRKVSIKDAADNYVHTLYNPMGLVRRIWGASTQPVEHGYDAMGRMTTMTTWRTGSFSDTDWPGAPGTGATTTWNLQPANGLLWWKTRADGNATVYGYDSLGRMNYRSWIRRRVNSGLPPSNPESAVITRWTYSSVTGQLTDVNYNDDTEPIPTTDLAFTYHRSGLLNQVTDATGTRTFAWRPDGQLESETLPAGFYGTARTIAPTYDASIPGRVTGLEFKYGTTVEFAPVYTFNSGTGRVATASGAGVTHSMGYTSGTDWLETVTSGDYTRTAALLANRTVIGKVSTQWNGSNVATYDSSLNTSDFNSRGLRAKVTQSGTVPDNGAFDLGYNSRSELTGSDWSVGATRDYGWNYDLMGKRIQATKDGSTTTYTPSSQSTDINQYASITGQNGESGLAYDYDGNISSDGTWTFTYDAENRPVQMVKKDGAQTLQFLYDYAGRRVRKTVRGGGPTAGATSSTKFVWSGWNLVAELDAGTSETGATLAKSFLWGRDFSNANGAAGGAGGLLAVKQGGVTYLPVYDTQGNVTAYLNASTGAVAAKWEYNSYGEVISSSGSTGDFSIRFAAKYTDNESGLVYYGLRYYNPKHGRFINPDPIQESGGLNLYNFTSNNPANAWDVLGLIWNCRYEDRGQDVTWGPGGEMIIVGRGSWRCTWEDEKERRQRPSNPGGSPGTPTTGSNPGDQGSGGSSGSEPCGDFKKAWQRAEAAINRASGRWNEGQSLARSGEDLRSGAMLKSGESWVSTSLDLYSPGGDLGAFKLIGFDPLKTLGYDITTNVVRGESGNAVVGVVDLGLNGVEVINAAAEASKVTAPALIRNAPIASQALALWQFGSEQLQSISNWDKGSRDRLRGEIIKADADRDLSQLNKDAERAVKAYIECLKRAATR